MNKPRNEYYDSEITKEDWISALPKELYESNVIDWLDDEINTYDFHNAEDFLNFINNFWFDKIYHISVYADDIDKFKDVKSVYDLLSRCKDAAWFEKLQLIIFKKWKDKYLSKEETNKVISEYADEYLEDSEETRKQMIEILKDSYDVSNLSDEKLRECLLSALNQEPLYSRILSDWWKYKYLVWWWKWSKASSWKYYIDVLKNNWVDMVEID